MEKRINSLNRILLILLTLALILLTCACTDSPQLFSRDATNADIYIDLQQEFSLNIKYQMTPNVDIKGLELTFTFSDKNRQVLTTKTKYVGDVTKGGQYTISISLTEFNLIDILKIENSSCTVTKGTVSYFD